MSIVASERISQSGMRPHATPNMERKRRSSVSHSADIQSNQWSEWCSWEGGGGPGYIPCLLKRFLCMNSIVYIFTNKSIWLSDGRIFRTNIIILMLITKNRVIVILNTFHQSSYCLSYVIGWCCFTSYQTINFYVKKSCIIILI